MQQKEKIEKRRAAIKTLIAAHQIEDQGTLLDLIKKHHKIETSQTVLSRDLRALGINKKTVKDRIIYDTQKTDPSKEILRLAVLDVQHNESLVVIHTLPGLAAFVADYLDMSHNTEILATLSGENVIFVTPKTTRHINRLYTLICSLVYAQHTT